MSIISSQELAIRAAVPTAVPITGTIPAENTLLIKDSQINLLTYEKLVLDSSFTVTSPGGVKTLSASNAVLVNIYDPVHWPVAVADHGIMFLDSASGDVMMRLPTNAPFNGIAVHFCVRAVTRILRRLMSPLAVPFTQGKTY